MENLPKISIIVPIRNEAAFIARTVKYLQEQDYPRDKMEILVVVGDSEDNTAEIVQEIAASDDRVKYFHNPKLWSSAARNIGAKNATGEIITYVDGHTYIDNDQLFINIARLMEEKEVKVLSRPQFLETPENNEFQNAVALARRSTLGHGRDSTIFTEEEIYVNPASSGASYCREIFDQVGYFDERFDAAEDYEFNYRVSLAGHQAFTSLKLAVYYHPRRTLGALFKQMARYGAGRMRMARKHPATRTISTLIPPLLLLSLLAWPIVSAFSSMLGNLIGIGLAGYFVIVLLSSIAIGNRKGSTFLFLLPPIYLAIHFGLGYGFIREAIFGDRMAAEGEK